MFCHDAHFKEPWPSAEICRAAIEESQRQLVRQRVEVVQLLVGGWQHQRMRCQALGQRGGAARPVADDEDARLESALRRVYAAARGESTAAQAAAGLEAAGGPSASY